MHKKKQSIFRPLTGEERAEPVVRDVEQLVLVAADHGHGGGVRGGDDVLQLLAGEDVGGREVSLSVAVLPGLGGGHVDHLEGSGKREQELQGRNATRDGKKKDNLVHSRHQREKYRAKLSYISYNPDVPGACCTSRKVNNTRPLRRLCSARPNASRDGRQL